MITSFKSLGQSGGGGGGYVLPTATANILGGVKIGDGINVEKDGTISVSGSDVANYAMALKSVQEGDENNYKVANYGGLLYYVEDNKNAEKNIFVKVMYDAKYVNIDMDIDGQTDTDIMNIENGDFQVTISIDSEGNLFYVDENDEEVYYDSETTEYQYGDFTFNWENDGMHIGFSQQANYIEAIAQTDNSEYWYCVAKDVRIANQNDLGLVKIGEGIDLSEDGTISVSGGDNNVLKTVLELPLSADTNDVYNYIEKQPIFSATVGNNEITTQSFSLSSGDRLTLHYEGRPSTLLRYRYGSNASFTRYISYVDGNYYRCGGTLGVTETLISDGDTDVGNVVYNITQNGDLVMSSTNYISGIVLLAELNKEEKYVEKLVKYTSESELTADIDEYQNVYGYYVIEYDEVPEEIVEICSMSGNNKSLTFYLNRDVILVRNYGSEYDYIKHNEQYQETANYNRDLHWEVTWFGNRISFGITNVGLDYNKYYSFNNATSYDWKKNGWIRANVEHNSIEGYYTIDPIYIRDSKGRIVTTREKNFEELKLVLNGSHTTSIYGRLPYAQSTTFGIFAPTTTGQTGYVCVAGSGNTAPTWKNPSTLLNKSTLYGTHSTFIVATDEWKLLDSSPNNTFDGGNFYIYNTCDFNEVTEIIDFNDSTDDGEGGMTEPTQELKVSANTDGSYDVFYGTYSDYEGGVYSYTASTHLDTVFSNYEILSEDQTGYVVRMILRPDGLYCYENYSGCGFVNGSYSTFGAGDSVTIGKMTVFAYYEDTPSVYLSQDEGV